MEEAYDSETQRQRTILEGTTAPINPQEASFTFTTSNINPKIDALSPISDMSTGKSKRGRRGKATKQKIASPISKDGATTSGRARPGDFDKQVKKIRRDMADIRANIGAAQQILERHELGKSLGDIGEVGSGTGTGTGDGGSMQGGGDVQERGSAQKEKGGDGTGGNVGIETTGNPTEADSKPT